MTTCIASICGDRKAIVIAADKMLGFGNVQSPVGDKILRLHRNWRVCYAGDDISPAYPIIDRAIVNLTGIEDPTSLDIATALTKAWKDERDARTEAKVLIGRRGWNLERFFNEGQTHFPPSDYARLVDAIEQEELDVQLLIAGFDDQKRPLIMSMDRNGFGIPERRAGYWAIGAGADNAMMFLSWREVKRSTPIRGALAFVLEAKFYGELAPVVSEETDLLIIQPDKEEILLNEEDVKNVLFQKIAMTNQPRLIKPSQLELLNNLKDLKGVPYVWHDGKRNLTEVKEKPPQQKPSRSANQQSRPRPKRGQPKKPASRE